jgi:PadR family transcriptional regulator PadR
MPPVRTEPTPSPPEFLAGTLTVMVLHTLKQEELHGYGIARAIEAASGAKLTIEEGSLYPALHRLEKRGDIRAVWRISHTKRRARYYSITPQGERHLTASTTAWLDVSGAVNRVLGLLPNTLRPNSAPATVPPSSTTQVAS